MQHYLACFGDGRYRILCEENVQSAPLYVGEKGKYYRENDEFDLYSFSTLEGAAQAAVTRSTLFIERLDLSMVSHEEAEKFKLLAKQAANRTRINQ
jgi:hypothetical protein